MEDTMSDAHNNRVAAEGPSMDAGLDNELDRLVDVDLTIRESEREPDYEVFGTLDAQEAEAIAERTETDSERRNREYQERRAQEIARVAPIMHTIAQAFNTSNAWAPFDGKRLYRMYASEDRAYLIADDENCIQLTIHEATWTRYDAHPAVLEHAKHLGHKPSDWQWAGQLGRVSACENCGAMARIDAEGKDLCEPYTKPCSKKGK